MAFISGVSQGSRELRVHSKGTQRSYKGRSPPGHRVMSKHVVTSVTLAAQVRPQAACSSVTVPTFLPLTRSSYCPTVGNKAMTTLLSADGGLCGEFEAGLVGQESRQSRWLQWEEAGSSMAGAICRTICIMVASLKCMSYLLTETLQQLFFRYKTRERVLSP